MNVIKIILKVKSPSSDVHELDFTDKSDEILEAVNVFNDKFRDWAKRVIVTQITKRAFHLILIMEKPNIAENLSVREIRYFIQYLRNNKSWNIYTKQKNKMFETVEFSKLDKDATVSIVERVKSNELLYSSQKIDLDFMSEVETIKIIVDNQPVDMDDEDTLLVLEYLIKTKDKGHKSDEKKEDMDRIKTILSKWL